MGLSAEGGKRDWLIRLWRVAESASGGWPCKKLLLQSKKAFLVLKHKVSSDGTGFTHTQKSVIVRPEMGWPCKKLSA